MRSMWRCRRRRTVGVSESRGSRSGASPAGNVPAGRTAGGSGPEPRFATRRCGRITLGGRMGGWRAMPRSVSETSGVFVGSARPAARSAAAIAAAEACTVDSFRVLGPLGEVGGHLRRAGVERIGDAALLAPGAEPVPLRSVGSPGVVGQRGRGRRGDPGAGAVVERGQPGGGGWPDGSRRASYRSRKGRQSVLSYASGFAFNSASCSLINALISSVMASNVVHCSL